MDVPVRDRLRVQETKKASNNLKPFFYVYIAPYLIPAPLFNHHSLNGDTDFNDINTCDINGYCGTD